MCGHMPKVIRQDPKAEAETAANEAAKAANAYAAARRQRRKASSLLADGDTSFGGSLLASIAMPQKTTLGG